MEKINSTPAKKNSKMREMKKAENEKQQWEIEKIVEGKLMGQQNVHQTPKWDKFKFESKTCISVYMCESICMCIRHLGTYCGQWSQYCQQSW